METGSNYQQAAPAAKKSKPLPILILAIVLVAVAAAAYIFIPRPYQKPLDAFAQGLEEGDTNKLLNTLPPDIEDIYKKLLEGYDGLKGLSDGIFGTSDIEGIDTPSAFASAFIDDYTAAAAGDNLKVSYKIKDKEKLKKDELKDLADDENSKYSVDILGVSLSEADMEFDAGYELEVVFTFKGDAGEAEETAEITAVKIADDWYILPTE